MSARSLASSFDFGSKVTDDAPPSGDMGGLYSMKSSFDGLFAGQPAFEQLDLGDLAEAGSNPGHSAFLPNAFFPPAQAHGAAAPHPTASSTFGHPSFQRPPDRSLSPLMRGAPQSAPPTAGAGAAALASGGAGSFAGQPSPFVASGGFLGMDQQADMLMVSDGVREDEQFMVSFGSPLEDSVGPLLPPAAAMGSTAIDMSSGPERSFYGSSRAPVSGPSAIDTALAAASAAAASSAAAPTPSVGAAAATPDIKPATTSSGRNTRRSTGGGGGGKKGRGALKSSTSSTMSNASSSASSASAMSFHTNQRRHQSSPAAPILAEVEQTTRQQTAQLDKIRPIQRQVLMMSQHEAFAVLTKEEQDLVTAIERQLKGLRELEYAYVMPATELAVVNRLRATLDLQLTQVKLFQQELAELHKQMGGGGSSRSGSAAPAASRPVATAARLCIVDHSFPMVATKGRMADACDAVTVQLLTGSSANCDFQRFSAISAGVVADDTSKAAPAKVLSNDQFTLDSASRTGQFRFKCATGTRKMPVSLKFSLKATRTADGQQVKVESSIAPPFIVITNEIQFDESACVLLRAELFPVRESDGGVADCRWPFFANKLQRTFVQGTRQDVAGPHRALSATELAHIQAKWFGGAQQISSAQFDAFWHQWFGKVLQKMRYQRHVTSLWRDGLIYGLIERHRIHELLASQPVGASLIRFSERHSGLFAVGYRIDEDDYEKCVRHYLITPEDTGPKKSLADFLGESEQFQTLCQLTGTVGKDGQPKIRFVAKDLVLHHYYCKPTAQAADQNISGYDTTLQRSTKKSSRPSGASKKKRK